MDFLLGLAAGYLLTWPGLIVLCALGIFFEHTNFRGFAVFTALVALVSSYFFFNINIQTLVYVATTYIGMGVAWSIYRYRRFVHAEVARLKKQSLSPDRFQLYLLELHPLKIVDTIVAWIIIWPFSAIEHAVGDILDTLQLLVTRVFRSVYVRIFEAATKGLID